MKTDTSVWWLYRGAFLFLPSCILQRWGLCRTWTQGDTAVCSPWRKGKQMACWPGAYRRRKQIASLGNPVPCPWKSRRPVLESKSLLRDLDTVSLQLGVRVFMPCWDLPGVWTALQLLSQLSNVRSDQAEEMSKNTVWKIGNCILFDILINLAT